MIKLLCFSHWANLDPREAIVADSIEEAFEVIETWMKQWPLGEVHISAMSLQEEEADA